MALKLNSKVVISPDVLFQEVNREMVLLDLRSESYFGLDETGTRIWQLLQSGLTLLDVIEQMLEEFDVQRTTLESDLNELMDRLLDAGLVRVEPAP